MATEIDHDANKERIEDILEASATLFGANDLTKIRSIDVGFPDGDPFNDQMFDYIFITNSASFETIRNKSSTPTSASKKIARNLEHTFNYDIVTVVNGKDARDAEKKLDDFQKLTLELLEADLSLNNGVADLVDMSFPVAVNHFRPGQTETKGVKGRIITLRCIKTTN